MVMELEDEENNAGKLELQEKDAGTQRDNHNVTGNPAKASSKRKSSEGGNSTLLKEKSKIVKKSCASRLVTEKKIPHVTGKGGEGSTDNVNIGEYNKQRETSDELSPENYHIAETNEVREGTSTLLKAKGIFLKESGPSRLKTKKTKKPRINKGKSGVSGTNNMNIGEGSKPKKTSDELLPENHVTEGNEMEASQKWKVGNESPKKNSVALSQSDKGKDLELHKAHQKQNKEKYLMFQEDNRRDKDSHDCEVKTQTNETRKERLGGLIFMCNGKTKPDCFRYRIMGVSYKNKVIVLGIKPGIKLFLFDFDLKLLYGIYSASSCGGMKLEPKAFGGAFPAQVRFNIQKDCFPLPESIFKKAIMENYDKKNRFKTELTVKQVRKLIQLFRPVGIHSLQPAPSPQNLSIANTKIRDGVRGGEANSHRDALDRDDYDNADVKNHNVLSHSRDLAVSNQDAQLDWREEIPRDLFITEKEYRAYAFNGKGRNLTPSPSVNTAWPEARHADLLHSNDKEFRTYVHGLPAPLSLPSSVAAIEATPVSSFTNNHQDANHYGTSSAETLYPFREEVDNSSLLAGGRRLIEADNLGRSVTFKDSLYSTYNLGRNETVQDGLYLRYAVDPLFDHNRTPLNIRTQPEPASLPFSSRYSFPGPSYLNR